MVRARAMRRFSVRDDRVAALPGLRGNEPRIALAFDLGDGGYFQALLLTRLPKHIQHDQLPRIWEHNITCGSLVNDKISFMICLVRNWEATYGGKTPSLG